MITTLQILVDKNVQSIMYLIQKLTNKKICILQTHLTLQNLCTDQQVYTKNINRQHDQQIALTHYKKIPMIHR